ncbi:MAG: hypothetical protein K8T91_01310 [Planctomycetes bacterium]|nr:hypothetical protein [Planctomycetota bacterium]
MALDRYAFCPGGTGKKIKFCCSDLVAELEHIQRSLEGEQRLAALERVRKSRAQHGDRACLLAIECLLEDDLEQTDQHAATLAVFAEKFPTNPVVLAETALSRADEEGAQAGVEPLQRAIAAIEQQIPGRVFEAIGIIGRLLIGQGVIMSGRSHLLLELALSGGKAQTTLSLLARLSRADDVPLLLKDDYHMELPPAGSPVEKEFQAALQLGQRGAWLAAAESLEKLAGRAGDVSAVWHNLGLLKAYVADHAGAAVALRKLSTLDIPEDDAIEAEALAQLLSADDAKNLVDVVAAVWTVADAADVQTRLGAANRAARMNFDPAAMAGADEPPPLSLFRLTDRAEPEKVEQLTRENVPSIIGQVAVFGRQTDREARIELIASRGVELEAGREVLSEILGHPLGFPEKEEIIRQIPAMQQAMTWRWQLPAEATQQQRAELSSQQHRYVIVELWPTLPNPGLGGRTPRDMAAEPASRIALTAAVLNLELASSRVPHDEIIAELRKELGLAAPGPIDPSEPGFEVELLPAARMSRLEVAKLTDDDLIMAYRRAAWLHYAPAAIVLAQEVVRRPSLDAVPDKADKAEAYGQLAEMAEDPVERLGYIDAARQVAEKRGESSAPWDLSELAVALESGDVPRFERLMEHIRDEHAREPGVMEALMNLLDRAGILGAARGRMPPGAMGGEPALAAGEQAAPAAGQIWTPGGGSAAPASGKKPVIWTPGS